MGERVLLKTFEDFAGLDYRRSPLTAESNECTSLKNLKFAEGLSLVSRYGFTFAGQDAGLVSGGVFSYFDRATGATNEVAFAMNDQLWYLSSDYFTVTRSGGVSWTWRWYPTSTGTTITIELIESGVVAHTTTFNNSNTVRDVFEWIDALANYSCSYAGKYAKVNSVAGNYTTIVVDNPHNYVFGDLVTLYDTFTTYPIGSVKNMLTARRVESVTATNIVISGDTDYAPTGGAGVGVTDNQVLGPLATMAPSIPYTAAGAESSANKTITFWHWAPAIWNSGHDVPFKTFHSLARSQSSSWRHASNVSAGNRLFIGTYAGADKSSTAYTTTQPQRSWEGFPHCFDGREVYRTGLPKAVLDAVSDTAGGTVPAGRYRWKAVFKYYSKNGDITFGQPSEYQELTTTAARYFTVSVFAPHVLGPKEIDAVGANATNTNTIQVATLDWLYKDPNKKNWEVAFLNRRPTTDRYTVRKVTGFNNTGPTITVDGPPVDVNLGDSIYLVGHAGGPYRGAVASSVATTVFTVADSHNIYAGDTVFFTTTQRNTATTTEKVVESRTVTSVTSTSITVAGPNLSAISSSHCDISAGATIELYRTKAGGVVFYKCGEYACHATGASEYLTIIDNCDDSSLGEQLIEPEIGKERDVPPQAAIVTGHQGGLVYTGIPTDPNSIAWNDLNEGLEAVPLASNYSDIASNQVGPISAAVSYSDDSLLVFKEAASYALSGDLNAGAFVSRSLSEGDYGIASHASIQKLNGAVVGVGKLGVMLFGPNGAVKEFGEAINTSIINNTGIHLPTAVACNDYINRQFRVYIPPITGASLVNALSFAYDYERDAWFNSSLPTEASQPTGGMFMFDNQFCWLSRQGYSGSVAIYSEGKMCIETSKKEDSGISASWLFCDGLSLQTGEYFTDWIHLGEPSFKKLFLRLKIFRFIPTEEVERVTSTSNFTVSFYRDWNTSTAFFSTTVTFGATNGYSEVERIIKLKNVSAKAILFKISATPSTLQSFFLSGWELAVATPYQTTDFLPAPSTASTPDPS